MAGDPNYGSVTLLLHADGSDGGTALVDHSVSALTPITLGGASLSTAKSRYGSASLLSGQGAGQFARYASNAAFGFGTDDFSLECSLCLTAGAGTDRNILDFREANGSDAMTWFINSSNQLAIWTGGVGGASGATLSLDTWYDLALVRASGTLRCFLGGSLQWSATTAVNLGGAKPLGIGGAVYSGGTGTGLLPAYIDEVRVTKGVARYTSDYTPVGPFKNGAYMIAGHTKDGAGDFASRQLIAHYRSTGVLAGKAVSDPITGNYELGTLTNDECYVVCLDDAGGEVFNDMVLRVTPV